MEGSESRTLMAEGIASAKAVNTFEEQKAVRMAGVW